MRELPFILHILIAFGALQAVFLSFIFFTRKKAARQDKFLAMFLAIEGITLIERLLAETRLIESVPHLLGISYPINFIKPPILFFMALAIIQPGFKLKSKHLLHTIPFFLMLLMNVPFYGMPASEKLLFAEQFIKYVPAYSSFDFWFFMSFFFYIGAYLWISISKLTAYQQHIKNNSQANWYRSVLRLYLFGLSLGFLYFLVRPSGIIEIPLFNLISMLVMTFLIQSIAYNFITNKSLLNGSPTSTLADLDQSSKDEKRVRDKLELEKVFLDDSLSLTDFANSLDLPKKYVSDLINQRMGYTFKEAVNHYRVEEAKRIMRNNESTELGLIQVGMKSGFNNKVSFYRTFKRFTGKSPSEFADTKSPEVKKK